MDLWYHVFWSNSGVRHDNIPRMAQIKQIWYDWKERLVGDFKPLLAGGLADLNGPSCTLMDTH